MAKKKDEKDVLVVRDEKTGEISVVAVSYTHLIYILGTNLFMIVETPLDFDWDTAMARMATLPRQAEWEEYMSVFQDVYKRQSLDTFQCAISSFYEG